MSGTPEVSTFLLVYNEEDNIRPMCEEILQVYDDNGLDGEILIVDDGSKDRSLEVAKAIAKDHPRVRYVTHGPNRGRSWAIQTAFAEVRGQKVVLLDGDRQYDNTEIPKLLDKLDEGWDVASGWRTDRADTPMRRLISRVYNRIIVRGILGVDTQDQNSGIKAFTLAAARGMHFEPDGYLGLHRFILPLANLHGYRVTDVPVRHLDRSAGASYIKWYSVPFITTRDLVRFWWLNRRQIRAAKRRRHA